MSTHMQAYYLQQMGIDIWQARADSSRLRILTQLESNASACLKCFCHKTRTKTLFSKGNFKAKLLIVCDLPDIFESSKGALDRNKACVLFEQILASIGLTSSDVYLTPLLKCSPISCATFSAENVQNCAQYLNKQIDAIAPNVIVALGLNASHWISQSRESINNLREKSYFYQDIPGFVSFEIRDLLENPQDKKKAYADWRAIKKRLN